MFSLEQNHSSTECHVSLNRMLTLLRTDPQQTGAERVPIKGDGLYLTVSISTTAPGLFVLTSFSLNFRQCLKAVQWSHGSQS